MLIRLIISAIVLLTLLCVGFMVWRLKQQTPVKVPAKLFGKLTLSGLLAFIADTLGVGSFAVNIALAKLMGTFSDDEMPAVNNGAQVVPGAIESLFFMQLVNVDLTTMLTLVAGTCIGGLIGGSIVSRLSKQAIRLAMVCCFFLIICLLICNHFHLLPVGGEALELHSWKLAIGFVALIICGALTSVGIGLFAMVQGVLFLLNVSPVVAFPIMTTAGAMQQPLTTMVFLKHDRIPLKKTLILSLAGCVGVFITLPIITHLTVTWLHTLLLGILVYNFIAIGRTFLKIRVEEKTKWPPGTDIVVEATS
jgi:uncharacterized membrane protein YfcA